MIFESSSLSEQGRISYNKTVSGIESFATLTVALSVRSREYPQRFLWARDNAFALEYTPDPQSPGLIVSQVKPFVDAGMPVRFHCRFFDYELGNADPVKAEEAVRVHLKTINAIAGLGEPVVTVHLNLSPKIQFDSQRGVENLTRLAEYGREAGITICLENLRRGPTSNPKNILAWARTSGAMITLDVGHAVSSEPVKKGEVAVTDFVELFHERLCEVHMYGKEEDRHYPIEDLAPLKPVIEHILATECTWWTIELDDYNESLTTRKLLTDYLKQRTVK